MEWFNILDVAMASSTGWSLSSVISIIVYSLLLILTALLSCIPPMFGLSILSLLYGLGMIIDAFGASTKPRR